MSPVRQLPVPNALMSPSCAADGSCVFSIASGPPGSVWLGNASLFLRIDVASWTLIASSPQSVGPHADLDDLEFDPTTSLLYASFAYTAQATPLGYGTEVRAFNAYTGLQLAVTSPAAPINDALGGGVTPEPWGVWFSGRYGMSGATTIFSQPSLTNVATPDSANDVYGWQFGANILYAQDTMWLNNYNGVWACLDPRTGAVRGTEQLQTDGSDGASETVADLVYADPFTHEVYGFTQDSGLIAVTPPVACWG